MELYSKFKDVFKEVKTQQEQEIFDSEWRKICIEKGALFYERHENSTRFFILSNDEIVGTVEFTKRDPDVFSICENYFPFKTHEKVSRINEEVFEVGKISIKSEHRKNNHVDSIVQLLFTFSEYNNVLQYIAFINIELHRLLILGYGVRSERLSEEVIGDTHTSVAILCDVNKSQKKLVERNTSILSIF